MYKVLIVDDDKTLRYILKRYKKWDSYGFTIKDEAGDGKEALGKLESFKFDLIITDIKMPGMDGIEFLQELKKVNCKIPVILLSAYDDFKYAQQGIRLGALDYMIKPVDDDVLDEALERAKDYIDDQYFIDKKNKELKKQLEEGLELYYPKTREKRLISLLLSGDDRVLEEAKEILHEVTVIVENDLFKIAMIMENILFKLWKKLCRVYPWFEKIEEINFENSFVELTSLKEIQGKYLRLIEGMLKTIKKYELHQNESIVKETCIYILDHVEEEISLIKISEEIHVSKDYIGKLFKRKTGYKLNDYITKVKMEHGKHLLKTGKYKNYEISERLGYSSPDYFCQLFKNYTGLTPLEYRKEA